MPPFPREPENYSIDAMVDRLNRSSSTSDDSKGELVTREDGTQVIRVRKRKRRSQQPQREQEKMEQRRRFVRILALLVFLILVAVGFAGSVIYSNSSPFRTALVGKIHDVTGADVDLVQFRMNPSGANANALDLKWHDGFPIESIQVRGLQANTSISSFFGRVFRGDELLASQATIKWRPPGHSVAIRNSDDAIGGVDFHRISVANFNMIPADGMSRMFRLRNSEASFYPNRGTGGRAQMRLHGGELQVPGLPKLKVDRALVEIGQDKIRLSIARLQYGEDRLGELLISGEIQPLDRASTATLVVESNAFILEGIVGERMGRIIAGRIDSSGVDGASLLRFPVENPSSGVLELDFKSAVNAPLLIRGFNFLPELAMLLGEPWFEQPYFEGGVTGIIHRSNGAVEIRNLQAEHRNRMALRGNIRMEESGRLSGSIEVGLSPSLVATAPTRRLHPVISEASGGYQWITIEIGGNITAPTDNFMSIVDNPPSRNVSPPAGVGSGGSTFEDLTKPR